MTHLSCSSTGFTSETLPPSTCISPYAGSKQEYKLTTDNYYLQQTEAHVLRESICMKAVNNTTGLVKQLYTLCLPIRSVLRTLCAVTLLTLAMAVPAFSQAAAYTADSVSKTYLQLKLYHQLYTQIEAEHRWTYFPADTVIRLGQASDLIYGIRSNLLLTGDLYTTHDKATNILDSLLAKAISRFQYRHGLMSDGIFGTTTLMAMNTPVSKRIEQIAINMDRWRAFSGAGRQPYVIVNIPDFTLQVIENDSVALKMKVIVGKKATKTMLIQSEIKHIVLNPSWNVPQSIAAKEILPLLKKNPQYLSEHQMRIYSKKEGLRTEIHPDSVDWQNMTPAGFHYLIEQIPGDINALGKVKFIFPNEYDIYLHDTAQRSLFSKTVRSMSHGCVRVEKPVELAAYLLRNDPAWSMKKINDFIAKGTESTGVRLRNGVPVSLVYFTAWVDEKAQLHFRNDIYNYDIPAVKPSLSSLSAGKTQAD